VRANITLGVTPKAEPPHRTQDGPVGRDYLIEP
jgi:hypothetical protein